MHWKLADYVDYPDSNPIFLHEGKIAPSDEGAGLKIVCRTADMKRERPLDPPLAWSSISKDGGKTWAQAKPEPDLPNHRSKAFFGRDSNERHIYVYSDSYEREGSLLQNEIEERRMVQGQIVLPPEQQEQLSDARRGQAGRVACRLGQLKRSKDEAHGHPIWPA